MSAVVMDGKALAAEIKQALRKRCAALSRPPRLAVVLVGGRSRLGGVCAIRSRTAPSAASPAPTTVSRLAPPRPSFLALIDTLNRDEAVDGILVQMPLPAHLDAGQVLRAIDPAKDVDAFSSGECGPPAFRPAPVSPLHPGGDPGPFEKVRH